MMNVPALNPLATAGAHGRRDVRNGALTAVRDRRPSCVHCVIARATARLRRCDERAFTVCSTASQAPLVAMDGPELYVLVSHFLRDAAADCPGDTALRVRIVSDVHPEVRILAVTGAKRATRVRTLAVPRHADGSLMGGFQEFYGDRAAVAALAVGA